MDPSVEVSFPGSVVDMMKGNLGQSPGGWPEAIQKKVLKGEAPITDRPDSHLEPVDIKATRAKLSEDLGVGEIDLAGNVNLSRFGDRIPGAVGFIDMTQGTHKVVFCTRLGDRHATKIVRNVQQITSLAPALCARGRTSALSPNKPSFACCPAA